MQHYLVLQYPYETIQVALCQNGNIIQSMTEHKFNAIRSTIPNIQTLLTTHNLKLSDIACIGVNVGPGPYNTLRALLTMANGIHFVTKIPLISLSALQLLQQEYPSQNSLVLLHAFADHVFYRLKTDQTIVQGGCSITTLLALINKQSTVTPIITMGNGAQKYKELLLQDTKKLIFPDPIQKFNSIEMLAKITHEKLVRKTFDDTYIQPIYFENLATKN